MNERVPTDNDQVGDQASSPWPPEILGVFGDHLNLRGNKRVFFSARFGTGKTHFLKEFFEKQSDDSVVHYILPTYYEISSHDEILELIRLDILWQLLEELDDQEIPLAAKKYLFASLMSHSGKLIKGIVAGSLRFLLRRVGLDEGEVENAISLGVNTLTFLTNDEKKALEEELNSKDPRKVQDEYFLHILEKWREKNKGKKLVLIIDDLDRLDPEHIFRILNSLSLVENAFYGDQSLSQGYDHTILVGDHESILSCYHHGYGEKTNADGYLSKFVSHEVFRFEPKELFFSGL